MADLQESLFAALEKMDSVEAIRILRRHPKLTNMRRTDDFEQEVTTPLIEACKSGRWLNILRLICSWMNDRV